MNALRTPGLRLAAEAAVIVLSAVIALVRESFGDVLGIPAA